MFNQNEKTWKNYHFKTRKNFSLIVQAIKTSDFHGKCLVWHLKQHITSPAPYLHRLSKYLAGWFRTVSQFEPQHTIKNSYELASEIQQIKFLVAVELIPFDVVSMTFTKIPMKQAIEIMVTLLQQWQIPDGVVKEFCNLLTYCVEKNLSLFQGTTHRLPNGLPMGGRTSLLSWRDTATKLGSTLS